MALALRSQALQDQPDRRWYILFRFSLEAGKGYFTTLRGDGGTAQVASSSLSLRDEASQRVASDSGSTAGRHHTYNGRHLLS